MSDEVLAELAASPGRRIFSCVVLGLLGLLLCWLAILAIPAFLWSVVFLAGGVGILFVAWWQFQVTGTVLQLTREELRTDAGLTLVAVANVARIDRGALAIKPSQGFMIRMHRAMPRAYALGLYWRLGRSLGVGGVTGAGQGKYMAETLQTLIDARSEA